MGAVQGPVTHVEYWLRSLSTAELDGRLVDHGQHAQWRHLLCADRRTHDGHHPVVRHIEETLQRKGIGAYLLCPVTLDRGIPRCPVTLDRGIPRCPVTQDKGTGLTHYGDFIFT